MATGDLTQTDRVVNTLLLVALALLGISGIVMLYGTWLPWVFDLHRATEQGEVKVDENEVADVARRYREALAKNPPPR